MILGYHSTISMHCNLLTDIRIAKETGYDGIEIMGMKLDRYLEQGFSPESLLPHLDGLARVGLGYVQDIDRQESTGYASLVDEFERMCSLAVKLQIPMIQLLPGPRYPLESARSDYHYRGLTGLPWAKVRTLTARNLARLADIGAGYKLKFYLEPLVWAPLATIKQGIEVIDEAGRDNVGIVIDLWHAWASGTIPDEIAALDKKIIMGVHFCDSLSKIPGDYWSIKQRDVYTGDGVIPLKEWVSAILSTGYDGWWSCEFFSKKHWEMDPWETARNLKNIILPLLFAEKKLNLNILQTSE